MDLGWDFGHLAPGEWQDCDVLRLGREDRGGSLSTTPGWSSPFVTAGCPFQQVLISSAGMEARPQQGFFSGSLAAWPSDPAESLVHSRHTVTSSVGGENASQMRVNCSWSEGPSRPFPEDSLRRGRSQGDASKAHFGDPLIPSCSGVSLLLPATPSSSRNLETGVGTAPDQHGECVRNTCG